MAGECTFVWTRIFIKIGEKYTNTDHVHGQTIANGVLRPGTDYYPHLVVMLVNLYRNKHAVSLSVQHNWNRHLIFVLLVSFDWETFGITMGRGLVRQIDNNG